jgi:hypothetical protein
VAVEIVPAMSRNNYGIALKSHRPLVTDQSRFNPDVNPEAVAGRHRVAYTIDDFGVYAMTITINGEPIKGSPFTLTVMRVFPPVQDIARFSNTATKITVQFLDVTGALAATNRAGLIGIEPCAKVLMPETIAHLGSGPLCSFPNDFQLDIFLGYAATIVPNDFITYKPTAIVNVRRNSFFTTGSSIVERPTRVPKPKLVVRAPVILSVCDDFVLDASGSYGTAGRQLNFSFGIFPNVPNEHAISEMLTRYSEVGTVNVVTIPGELLLPDISYHFVVSVANFLREITQRTVTVVRRSFAVPRVLVQGDPVLRTTRDQGLYVRAAVSVPEGVPLADSEFLLDNGGNVSNATNASAAFAAVPSCAVPYPEMEFRWLYDTSTAEAKRGGTFAFDPKTRFRKTLYIAPNSLTSGETYFLRVVGCVVGHPDLCNEAHAQIEVSFSAVSVKLSAPMVLQPLGALTLNASSSVDPDDPTPSRPSFPFGAFMYRWQCINVTSNGVTPEPFPLNSCFKDVLGVLSPDPLSPELRVPPGLLQEGTYLFVLSYTKEPLFNSQGQIAGRMGSIRRVLTVKSPAPPKLVGNVTLAANISLFQANPVGFRNALTADLAAGVDVSASRVRIRRIYPDGGSVIVDFEILSPGVLVGTGAKTLAAVTAEAVLGTQVTFATLQSALNVSVSAVDLPRALETRVEDVAADAIMPVVIIQPLRANVVNANKQLVIAAGIQTSPGQNISLLRNHTTYYWDVMQGMLALDFPEKLATPRTNANLVVRKDVLAPGETYVLRLTAVNTESGLSGFDEVSFVVNGAPSSGTFDVTPSMGFAGETEFTLRCIGWEDDGTDPVEFEFRYYDPATGAHVPLVARARDNEVMTIVPPVTAESSGYELVITAHIVDFYNAKTQVNRTVVVKPPKYDETTTATVANGSAPFDLSGSLAFTQNLLDSQLRTAKGTNNVPLLLTIAQAVVVVNNNEALIRRNTPKPVILPGLDYTPSQRAQLDADLFYIKESTRQLETIMEALEDAVNSVKVKP